MDGLTQTLVRVQEGDGKAAAELLPLVYGELRRLAARKMANEPAGHTLQPTALVHEAWLKVAGADERTWNRGIEFGGRQIGRRISRVGHTENS
jgi:hypothetical protein